MYKKSLLFMWIFNLISGVALFSLGFELDGIYMLCLAILTYQLYGDNDV